MLFRNSLSLPHHLFLRELNIYPGIRHPVPSHFLYHEKNIYKSVTPRMTIINVEVPDICIRKFTPRGDQLIAFSEEQTTLEVYRFQGVQSAAFLVYHDEEECVSDNDSFLSAQFRERLFEVMFSSQHHIHVVPTTTPMGKEFLNREFSLFLDDGRYVLLASTTGGSIFPNYFAYQDYMDLYDETELYDYTFHLIDLKKGFVADTYQLKHDFIVLSHNHSVSLHDHTLAILSTYRQCIEIVDVNFRDGELKHISTIGPYGSDFDRDRILAHQRKVRFFYNPQEKLPLSHLKQKILAHMYREIMNLDSVNERCKKLKEFYKNYAQVERMIISKMQLIDSYHLLLRYEKRQTQFPLDLGGVNLDKTNKNFKLFVFYKIYEQEVVKIFTQDSLELMQIVRNYCDVFRNVRSLQIPWQASSPGNNEYLRASFDEAFKTFSGGVEAATARFNATLPISSQSFSTSPYLDFSIFKYDDRYISALERPRIKSTEGIEFFDRETENLLYRAHLEQQYDLETPSPDATHNTRDLVSFIFHPFEPFFISVQKFTSNYVINFHIHNAYTKVEYYSDDLSLGDYSSDENDNGENDNEENDIEENDNDENDIEENDTDENDNEMND